MLHIELKTTHETGCSILFPSKLTTCPTLHVRPTFADSPLIMSCRLEQERYHDEKTKTFETVSNEINIENSR